MVDGDSMASTLLQLLRLMPETRKAADEHDIIIRDILVPCRCTCTVPGTAVIQGWGVADPHGSSAARAIYIQSSKPSIVLVFPRRARVCANGAFPLFRMEKKKEKVRGRGRGREGMDGQRMRLGFFFFVYGDHYIHHRHLRCRQSGVLKKNGCPRLLCKCNH
jgi:hypothetical protein